jgi:hypothetical protein
VELKINFDKRRFIVIWEAAPDGYSVNQIPCQNLLDLKTMGL